MRGTSLIGCLAALLLMASSALAEPSRDGAGQRGRGLEIPYLDGVRLNGSFDLNYERRGFTDNPAKGRDAIKNYHRFLFLSRHGKNDPFFLNVELIDLTFYEIGARFDRPERPWTVTVKGGKIMVPFGADPLFHSSYGGLSGFDQEILPVVWSELGGTANLTWNLVPELAGNSLRLSNDLYGVRGHRLRNATDVLNIQTAFSSEDDVQFAMGNRIGLSWGPASGWYSAYYNEIGFGQRLFLQALDFTLWRIAEVPVLDKLSFGMGALRGDVSGRPSGEDYYHFGSYFDVRYYPLDWLYLRYRSGFQSFDNRSGVFFDDDRAGDGDGTTHSIGLVYMWRGFSTGVYWYWRLEEGIERANDFARVRVGYDF